MPLLSDFVDISLGFKSLMNDFFYVDQAIVDRFGIESRYLIPVFKLADLDERAIAQSPTARRWLLHCRKEPADIRGTGVQDYIDWGARQETRRKKKQAKDTTTWKDALTKQGQKHWWWPAQPATKGTLAVRKGYGVRYGPFVFKKPCLLDQRLYRVTAHRDVPADAVLAFFCSSFFPLSLETNADLGLGAGVLTVGTRSLKALSCVDLKALAASSAFGDVKSALADVLAVGSVTAQEYTTSNAVRALDEAVLESLGYTPDDAPDAEAELLRLAVERLGRSSLRKVTRTASSKADIQRVAEPIVARLQKWWRARQFPEDFLPIADARYNLPNKPLMVEVTYVMGEAQVRISDDGALIMDQTLDLYAAELVLRTLQLGRREFKTTSDGTAAGACLTELDNLLRDFEGAFLAEIGGGSLGMQYDEALQAHVLRELHLQVGDLRRPLDSSSTWEILPVG